MPNNSKKNSWITDERVRKSGCNKREVLAKQIGTSPRNLRRWGQSKLKESTIPFDKFAELFQEDEFILRKEYLKVRKENGFMNYALDEGSRESLKAIITECHANHLLLNSKTCKNQATDKLFHLIVDALEKGVMQPISVECSSALTKNIKSANQQQLVVVRQFVVEVAKASMLDSEERLDGGKHTLTGRAPAWLIRMLIDTGEQLEFFEKIGVTNRVLDNDSIPHIQLSEKTVSDDVDSATHALICTLNKKFRPMVSDPPWYREDPVGFENYCEDFNAFFTHSNSDEDHCFCIANKGDVYDLLISYFSDLRIYEKERETSQESAHSRLNDIQLGAWLGKYLGAIIERNNAILEESDHSVTSPADHEKEGNMSSINFNPHIEINPTITQTNTQNNTQTNSSQWQQFHQAIDALNKNIQENISNPDYRELKNAVRDIREHVEETGEVHKDSESWLKKAMSVISNTNTTWNLTEKAIKAISLLNNTGLV